jgi:hypothetical protein
MKEQTARAEPGDVINLAGTPDFRLGALSVQPSLRRVSAAGRDQAAGQSRRSQTNEARKRVVSHRVV